MQNIVRAAASLAAAMAVAACATAGSSSTPPSTPSVVASLEPTPSPVSQAPSSAPSPSAGPTSFTSTTYGYSVTLPAGWNAVQAVAAWDGKASPSFGAPEFDKFAGTTPASVGAFAAPTPENLAGYVKQRIAANAADHGDTCPPVPEVNDPIEIGGEPGTLLGWNCGILINQAVTVHNGIGYLFGMRDPAIHAATYPADRALLLEFLGSVSFPE